MGLFFDSPRPRVTPYELKLVKGILRSKYNFTEREANQVEEVFRGDIDEQKYLEKGIDTTELVKGIEWMRSHLNVHHISPKKIDILEIEMMKKITTNTTPGIF